MRLKPDETDTGVTTNERANLLAWLQGLCKMLDECCDGKNTHDVRSTCASIQQAIWYLEDHDNFWVDDHAEEFRAMYEKPAENARKLWKEWFEITGKRTYQQRAQLYGGD